MPSAKPKGRVMNQSFYYWYEAAHALMSPARAGNDAMRSFYSNPANPLSQTAVGRNMAAACELFERVTRRYGKPRFDLGATVVDGALVSVDESIAWSKPFCNLIRFKRRLPAARKPDPKLLIVAPMSGHYATLLRGTVEAFLPGMMSTSPTGRMRARLPSAPADSILMTISTMSSTCCAHWGRMCMCSRSASHPCR